MHKIRILLLALLFLCGSFAAAMTPVHTCCPIKQCTVAQCIDMGCAPAALLIAPGAAISTFGMISPAREQPVHLSLFLSERYEEVWTPPD